MRWRVMVLPALCALCPQSSPAAPLSLDEAVTRALAYNPTVRAARATQEGAAAEVRAARGARVPTIVVSGQGGHAEGLAAAPDGITTQQSQTLSADAEVSILTDLGTRVAVGVSSGLSWRSTNLDPSQSRIFELGPLYSGSVTLDVQQPILRGAGADGARGAIDEATIRAVAARRAFEDTISQVALDVSSAHRELWYAQQALRIANEAVELSYRQAEQARLRMTELGSVPGTEVLRYASELARMRRAQALAASEVDQRALELGRLLSIDPGDALQVVAETSTTAPVPPVELARLEAAALGRSRALLSSRADVSAAAVRLRAAENAAQPRADLFGRAEASLLFDADSLRAVDLPRDRPALSAWLGLEIELPLGVSQQQGERDAARAAHLAAVASYDQTTRRVLSRVANHRSVLVAAALRIRLAAAEVLAAAELAEAERARVGLGTGTAIEVLAAQQTERDTRLLHLRAQVDYAHAEAQLAHDTGALYARLAPANGSKGGRS